jgi:ABC-2 type transport system ATP-binding protein
MIKIDNVTFAYRKGHKVLEGFSLDFKPGAIYGLLAKNGMGKSTLLYLMMGLLRPQKGEVIVCGLPSSKRHPEVLKDMFLVPEEYELPSIKLKSYINVIKPFYPKFSDQLLSECLSCFEISEDINLGNLSMGQKKKVYMCIALATNASYLLMDEPTNGLDILSKNQFRKAILNGMSPERTIIISTHQVHDVENLLTDVVILDHNKVLLNQTITADCETVNLENLFIETITRNAL